MKHIFLHDNENDKLILFFNGWSCDDRPFQNITCQDSDVIMLYDYRDLTLPTDVLKAISNYQNISVVAWSFGVWVAQQALYPLKDKLQQTIAVNGTIYPVDKDFGIPAPIALGTLSGLSDKNLQKFHRRMFSKREDWSKFEGNYPQRSFDEVKNELFLLLEHFKVQKLKDDFYQRAIVGKDDLIFSAVHQLNYWQGQVELIELNQGHFCFYEFKDWNEIIHLK